MSERPTDPMGAFELQLSRELLLVSGPALRSVDAIALAHELATTAPSSRLRWLSGFKAGHWIGLRLTARPAVVLAAVAVVFAVGVGSAVLKQPHGVAADSSPTPSASPSASPSTGRAVVDMTELQSSWKSVGTRKARFVNGNHSIETDAQLNIFIGHGTLTIMEQREDVLNSVALTSAGAVRVQLLSEAFDWTCQIGDAGEYEVGLSSDGQTMTITVVDDACQERAAILIGPWDRTDIGPLLPGDHASKLFRPFGTSGQLSTPSRQAGKRPSSTRAASSSSSRATRPECPST
jgi:hypothetical protein